jgi:hypothetical protein
LSPQDDPQNFPARFFRLVANSALNRVRNIYFMTRESLGHTKRDEVVNRVVRARDSLESAKGHFKTALYTFSATSDFNGGSLKTHYLKLKQELETSSRQAQEVSTRIRGVEAVCAALFDEWELELAEYNNRQLKSTSKQQLKQARQHYKRLIIAMHQAEAKISPVMSAFKDQVLFLKHNLNAQAISSLHQELRTIGIDIALLIKAMENSIIEANAFMDCVTEQKALPQG